MTRKGQEPPNQNPAKRLPPVMADKSYDRHITDSGAQLRWMREAGMLDSGYVPRGSQRSVYAANAGDPDHVAHAVPVMELRAPHASRDYTHLYSHLDTRPSVTGEDKGPAGVLAFTASAGSASGSGGGAAEWTHATAFKRGPAALRTAVASGGGLWDWQAEEARTAASVSDAPPHHPLRTSGAHAYLQGQRGRHDGTE